MPLSAKFGTMNCEKVGRDIAGSNPRQIFRNSEKKRFKGYFENPTYKFFYLQNFMNYKEVQFLIQ